MKKILLFLSLALAITMFTSCGDDDTTDVTTVISGTVSDDLGTALEGVTVTDGSTTATTDAAGTYTITVPENATLTFSKDGYDTVEIPVGTGTTIDATINRGAGIVFAASFGATGNQYTDPGINLTAATIKPSANLGTTSAPGGFFDNTSYHGAVDPNAMVWYSGWSSYENILSGGNTKSFTEGNLVTITDADMMAAGNDVQWTKDNTYILDGFVFVNDGQTLNIEAGTVIKGKSGEAENASALIIAQGGKIMAMGTAAEPIIFTAEGDDGSGQSPATRGLWGGLIILGKAGLNSTPGTSAIEGIPTNEPRGTYGGSDDADNSGVLTYVSIRHGGTNIGEDNEINGLTLGGVGTGTTIDYVEIIANKDDGVEWFGGTVNAKHILSIFCGDDALDYDEGFRGQTQYVVIHQDPSADAADRGGEHDGGTDPETGSPYATPVFVNVTSIGNPDSRAITFRDNAGGQYHNSIFINYGRGIDIEDLEDQDQDSYKQWVDGELVLENNVFWNIGAGETGADLFKITN